MSNLLYKYLDVNGAITSAMLLSEPTTRIFRKGYIRKLFILNAFSATF